MTLGTDDDDNRTRPDPANPGPSLGPGPRTLIPAPRIRRRVRQLGRILTTALAGRSPLCITLLDGCFCFAADLLRSIAIPDLQVHFARASSYLGQTTAQQTPTLGDLPTVSGRHLLLLDDILDSGATLDALYRTLTDHGASSITTCVLLDKSGQRRVPFTADHVGFVIPNRFVVGYGLDYRNRFRHLPDICTLEP